MRQKIKITLERRQAFAVAVLFVLVVWLAYAAGVRQGSKLGWAGLERGLQQEMQQLGGQP